MNFFLLGPWYKLQVNLFFFLIGPRILPKSDLARQGGFGAWKKKLKKINKELVYETSWVQVTDTSPRGGFGYKETRPIIIPISGVVDW